MELELILQNTSFDDKCGMPLYLSEHEIDDMCRVEKS